MNLGGVDDWMKSQLRLAERQGLLQGRHLSPVQFHAGIVLNLEDGLDKTRHDHASFKNALVAAGAQAKALFPEYFPEEKKAEVEEVDFSDAEASYDYSDVEWKSPSDNPAEFNELMAQVANLTQGTMNGSQFTPDQGWR